MTFTSEVEANLGNKPVSTGATQPLEPTKRKARCCCDNRPGLAEPPKGCQAPRVAESHGGPTACPRAPGTHTAPSLLFGPLFLGPRFLSAAPALVTAVPPLLPQVFLHLQQRVQAALDLHIWSWAGRGCPSLRGQLVPGGLSLGFRGTLAQVRQDAQSFLLLLLRGRKPEDGQVSALREPWV